MEIRLCHCNKFNSRQQIILTPSDDNGKHNAKLLQNYSPEMVPPLLAEDIRNKNTNILDTNKKESSLTFDTERKENNVGKYYYKVF